MNCNNIALADGFFQVKMLENGRTNIFTEKQTTNKVPVMLLYVKVLTERQQLRLSTLSTNKQGVAFKNFNISSKKGQHWSKS